MSTPLAARCLECFWLIMAIFLEPDCLASNGALSGGQQRGLKHVHGGGALAFLWQKCGKKISPATRRLPDGGDHPCSRGGR